jgi:hypothetical protein
MIFLTTTNQNKASGMERGRKRGCHEREAREKRNSIVLGSLEVRYEVKY